MTLPPDNPGVARAASNFDFVIEARSGRARAGLLRTPHGSIWTPAFLPVASRGAVWGTTPAELREAQAGALIVNSLLLTERPGAEVIESLGGLHEFMAWPGPLASDSGGFQVHSLSSRVEVDDDGVTYRSPYDSTQRRLTPEAAVREQSALGADLIYCLDDVVAANAPAARHGEAARRTTDWAGRALAAQSRADQLLVGVIQGGTDPSLRERSALELVKLELRAFAIGGLSLGESRSEMLGTVDHLCGILPDDVPRHLMGVGDIEGIAAAVRLGVDLFDSVWPVRLGRHGTALSWHGRLNLRAARFASEDAAIDAACSCSTCAWHTRAYLHHLLLRREPLAGRLITLHNLTLLLGLMSRLRSAILAS